MESRSQISTCLMIPGSLCLEKRGAPIQPGGSTVLKGEIASPSSPADLPSTSPLFGGEKEIASDDNQPEQ